MCVCVYIYIYIYIYISICVYVCSHTGEINHKTYIHKYIHIYIHTCICVCVCVCVSNIHTHACMHAYIHTYQAPQATLHTAAHAHWSPSHCRVRVESIHTCMHRYIDTCMHAYIHTYNIPSTTGDSPNWSSCTLIFQSLSCLCRIHLWYAYARAIITANETHTMIGVRM